MRPGEAQQALALASVMTLGSVSPTMHSPTFAIFAIASFLLAITPGPGVLFLITRTLSQGRGAGLASIGGLALGSFGNLLVASLGLAVIFAVSSAAFTIVKLAGASYLVFLGIKALRASTPGPARSTVPTSSMQLFRGGFFVGLLNPKTALFFAAFLPQFIDPQFSAFLQSVMLGCTFIAIAACTDTLYVLATASVGTTVLGRLKPGRLGRYITASTFIGLGVYVALAAPQKTK